MAHMHPAYRLACWLIAVVAVQALDGWPLAAALGMSLLLLDPAARRRWWRLAWRTRWLLASLLAVLAWGVPGEPLVADGGAWMPTFEGLADGGRQLGRLLLALGAVALLVETTPLNTLMAGCHALLRPFSRLGLDVDRAVVRLMLALHYAERMPAGDWRSLLQPAGVADAPVAVVLSRPPVTGRDRLLAAVVLTACLLAFAA